MPTFMKQPTSLISIITLMRFVPAANLRNLSQTTIKFSSHFAMKKTL